MKARHFQITDKDLLLALTHVWPDFPTSFKECCESQYDCTQPCTISVQLFDGSLVRIKPDKYEVTVYEAYDPKAWNKFPEVEPPCRIWMRCERTDERGRSVRFAAMWALVGRDWRWVDEFGQRVRDPEYFRPWDDEDEEGEDDD